MNDLVDNYNEGFYIHETWKDFIYVIEQRVGGKYLVLSLDDRKPEYIYLDLDECGYIPLNNYNTQTCNLLLSRLNKIYDKFIEEQISIKAKLDKIIEIKKELNSKRTTRPLTDVQYLNYAKVNKDLSLHNRKDELWILDPDSKKEFHRIDCYLHAYICKNLHTGKSIKFTDNDLVFYCFKDN